MIFENLVLRCLVQGTSYSEPGTGKTIKLKVEPGEKALFFKIDDDTKKACLRISGKCSDCLIYFSDSSRRILCLAELKGKDTEHAAKQIINTYDSLVMALGHSRTSLRSHVSECSECKSHFKTCPECRAILDQFKWKAFIYQRGSSPNKLDAKLAGELIKRFGKHREGYDFSESEDIGYLLRK